MNSPLSSCSSPINSQTEILAVKRTFLEISPRMGHALPRTVSMPTFDLDICIEEIPEIRHDAQQYSPISMVSPSIITPDDPGDVELSTLMLRNIPNKLTQLEIADFVKSRNVNFDFLYAPLDFKSHMNLGYCFINFISNIDALKFWKSIEGQRLADSPSSWSAKKCEVTWARIQGLERNVRHYKNSPINELPWEFRPCLFDRGVLISFPGPDKPVKCAQLPKASRLEKKKQVTQQNKIFIGGLTQTTTSEDLEIHFSQFGIVEEAVVLLDRQTGISKGFGFCTFVDQESANMAIGTASHWIDGISVAVRPYTSNILL
jgi:RNA recognition motif-containing protein